MKKGDFVNTPRFLKVRIERVFSNRRTALQSGYTEPTNYRDYRGYQVYGKHTGPNLMIFAAVKPAINEARI